MHIYVAEENRDLMRFLWRDNEEDDIKVFRFKKLPMGNRDSPFLAMMVLKHHCTAIMEDPNTPEAIVSAAALLLKHIYVDDVSIAASSTQECTEIYEAIKKIMDSADLKLRKLVSNDRQFLASQPEEEKVPLNEHGEFELQSVLGQKWNPNSDVFQFPNYAKQAEPFKDKCTRRIIATLQPTVYDLLGLVAPYSLNAKLVLKAAWELKDKQWDDELPDEIRLPWFEWTQELAYLATEAFYYPRTQLLPTEIDRNSLQLLCFADASNSGAGIICFLRFKQQGMFVTHKIIARSLLLPKSTNTVPRKELYAARKSVTMSSKLQKFYNLEERKVTHFSDSVIVLFWINTEVLDLRPYVATRIKDIQEKNFHWRFVNSDLNPADVCSRGSNLHDLAQNELYKHGPDFIRAKKTNWPANPDYLKSVRAADLISEVRKQSKTTFAKSISTNLSIMSVKRKKTLSLFDQHSHLYPILQKTAMVLRFVSKCARRTKSGKPALQLSCIKNLSFNGDSKFFASTEECEQAILFWIKAKQQEYFKSEIDDLKNDRPISKQSELRALNPKYDATYDVLRVGGRLDFSKDLSYDEKFPIILPSKDQEFVPRLLRYYHTMNHHMANQHLISFIRQKYWIPQARRSVAKAFRNCDPCKRAKAKSCGQIMAPLPPERCSTLQPFAVCSVDLAGPFYIKTLPQSDQTIKMWVALFCCHATRYVVLEPLLAKCDSKEFIQSITRVCAQVPPIKVMWSDQGPQMKKSQTFLRKLYEGRNDPFAMDDRPVTTTPLEELKDISLEERLSKRGITWQFATPLSPHKMGVHECLMKSFKEPLAKTIGAKILSVSEMTTILRDIQGMLNSRPLVVETDDPSDFVAITPAKMMIGYNHAQLPQPKLTEEQIKSVTKTDRQDLLKRWQLRHAIAEQYWRVWRSVYLKQMQQRDKWQTEEPDLKVGDMVLINEKTLKRQYWPLGRVIGIKTARDGHIRSVRCKTPSGDIVRSIHLLHKLEL